MPVSVLLHYVVMEVLNWCQVLVGRVTICELVREFFAFMHHDIAKSISQSPFSNVSSSRSERIELCLSVRLLLHGDSVYHRWKWPDFEY